MTVMMFLCFMCVKIIINNTEILCDLFYSGKKRINVRRIILVTVPTIILMNLLFVAWYFQRRNTRKSHATILKENCTCCKKITFTDTRSITNNLIIFASWS